MFRNYLTTALRNLVRNRLYAAINIVGLSVGFAAALLIALFVRDEFSYDKWIPGYQDVWHVNTLVLRPSGAPDEYATTSADLAGLLKLEFPGVQAAARLAPTGGGVRRGDIEAFEQIGWADADLFKVLPLPVIAGDLDTALARPDGLVLTRKMARKYFGRDTPLGEQLELDRRQAMRVVAVVEDLPSNTHLNTEIFAPSLAPFSNIAQTEAMPSASRQNYLRIHTYVRLAPGTSIGAQDIQDFAARHMTFDVGAGRISHVPRLVALASIHLDEANLMTDGGQKPTGSLRVIYAVSVIGGLILVATAINFINAMTARASRRAVEVGVRKTAGARRGDLIVQFEGEALIFAALGMMLTVALVQSLLPSFNSHLQRDIVFGVSHDGALAAGALLCTLLVGALAGFYPALVLSAFRPAPALKDSIFRSSGSGRVRQSLVVLQFAILIGMALASYVVYRQTVYATQERLRMDSGQALIISTRCDEAFMNRVRALPGVEATTCSSNSALNFSRTGTMATWRGGEALSARVAAVDFGFLEFYALRPLAGRFFSTDHGADSVSQDSDSSSNPPVVVNAAAVRALGFPSAEDAVGQTLSWDRLIDFEGNMTGSLPSEIVGVAPDFALASARTAIEPTIYYVNPGQWQQLNVRLRGHDLPESLASLTAIWRELAYPRPIRLTFVSQHMQNLHLDIVRQTQLFTAFLAVGFFAACLGLFSLSAFTVERRVKEIGVRKALGASRTDILRMMVWEFAQPVLWANVIAWPAAYVVMRRWLEGFAYHIDLALWMFVAASALALVIAVLTVAGHTLLVARAQPVAALRYE